MYVCIGESSVLVFPSPKSQLDWVYCDDVLLNLTRKSGVPDVGVPKNAAVGATAFTVI